MTIVFLFERFETYIPQLSASFFNNLRSMRSRAKYKCAFVFSTTRPLEDALDTDILADFYEFIADNHIFVTLKDMVELDFRIDYLEKLTGKKLPQKIITTVIEQTGGHRKLTRLLFEMLFAREKTDLTKEFMLQTKTVANALKEIWQFLTPDEQQDILHICRDGHCPDPNVFLQRIHLLEKDTITIPLFAQFAKEMFTKQKEHAPFTYDSTTNTITRAGTTISDFLTNAEFRLFKLLLEKKDIILDREEIIRYVWSDTKTQEGVSDQAVDQLVFRLRKKIEDDPNNPTHILTVKGRGIRFVE